MSKKNILSLFMASVLGAAFALSFYLIYIQDDFNNVSLSERKQEILLSKFLKDNANTKVNFPTENPLNFVSASEKTLPGVVHIRNFYASASSNGKNESFNDLLKEFFGGEEKIPNAPSDGYRKSASGSGVIISADGYIVTNNHVVENADKLEIVLYDKRTYTAKIIGTDPTTDLALIKIEEKDLSFIPYGNSDALRVGEWVLAVGNPFDLTSTVTAGIVSAKARNINILRSKSGYAIESFIQTDAAVNPGNSGGALVDLNGNLVGVNTAIATHTGSFSGYSFAVPATLVQKVMNDLLEYGEVQRAIMGVQILDLDAALAKEKNIQKIEGVYVAGASDGGGAKDAGIEEGDIILTIDKINVNTVSELQELVARKRPGEKIKVTYKREEELFTVLVLLKNTHFTTEIVKKPKETEKLFIAPLKADFRVITEQEKEDLKIKTGVKVVSLKFGKLKAAGVREGFIITHIDKELIKTPQELADILKDKEGGILIQGIYPDGEITFYGLGFE